MPILITTRVQTRSTRPRPCLNGVRFGGRDPRGGQVPASSTDEPKPDTIRAGSSHCALGAPPTPGEPSPASLAGRRGAPPGTRRGGSATSRGRRRSPPLAARNGPQDARSPRARRGTPDRRSYEVEARDPAVVRPREGEANLSAAVPGEAVCLGSANVVQEQEVHARPPRPRLQFPDRVLPRVRAEGAAEEAVRALDVPPVVAPGAPAERAAGLLGFPGQRLRQTPASRISRRLSAIASK